MKYSSFIVLMLLFCACNSEKDAVSEDENSKLPSQSVLNLALLYSEYERYISFPVLFNDSIVKARGVTSIERTFYYSPNDTLQNGGTEIASDKAIVYHFDKKGKVKSIHVENYYDFKTISSLIISYTKQQEISGFASTKISNNAFREQYSYKLHKEGKTNRNLYRFKVQDADEELFLVPHRKHWKPLVIDTLIRPDKNDLIVWGSLKQPHKIYQVSNLVEESNVREFAYKDGALKSITWTDDPFKIERTIRYNEKGICNGFIDSTFSMGGFVSSSQFDFTLKDELPVEIKKTLFSSSGNRVIFKEVFTYNFTQKKK